MAIRPKHRNINQAIHVQHGGSGMPVGVAAPHRDDRYVWIDSAKEQFMQRPSRAMMRNLQYSSSKRRSVHQALFGFLFNIAGEERRSVCAREADDHRFIVQMLAVGL